MAGRWLFRPLPLQERVGRGVAPVSSTLRTRRLVVPSPPTPNPLPRGEREPEVPAAKSVFANSTVLPFEGPALRFRSRWLEGLAVRKRGGLEPRHTPPPSRPKLTAAPGRRRTES